MKRSLSFILVAVFSIISLLTISTGVEAKNEEVKITINGIPLQTDVPAQIVNGSTLVPMRAILEKFEFDVEWDHQAQTAIATKPGLLVELKIDSKVAIVNNREVPLDQPAIIIGGRTMAPIRFISELLGAKVDWDGVRRLTLIDGLEINDNSATVYYGNEHLLYKGEVKNGLPHGKGTVYYDDLSVKYIGTFKDGKLEGYAYHYDRNGKLLYKGNYKNDKRVVVAVGNSVYAKGKRPDINLLNLFGKSKNDVIKLLGSGHKSGTYASSNYVQYDNFPAMFLDEKNIVRMLFMDADLTVNGKSISRSMTFSELQKTLGVSATTGFTEYDDSYYMSYRMGIYRFNFSSDNSSGINWILTIKDRD